MINEKTDRGTTCLFLWITIAFIFCLRITRRAYTEIFLEAMLKRRIASSSSRGKPSLYRYIYVEVKYERYMIKIDILFFYGQMRYYIVYIIRIIEWQRYENEEEETG